MWGMMAKAAQAKIKAKDADPYYPNKVATGLYFIERVLPDTAAHLAKLKTGSASMMALAAEAF